MKTKSLIILLILVVVLSNICYAHTTPQGNLMDWGELIGWGIYESAHVGTSNSSYYLKANDTYIASLSSEITDGDGYWSGLHTFTKTTSSGIGVIQSTYDPNTTGIAWVTRSADASYHITSYTMTANEYYSAYHNKECFAHEFGHIVGLRDLYNYPENYDKIMFGYGGRTQSSLHRRDILGAKVILGIHTNHTWTYTGQSSAPDHFRQCSYCYGYKEEACDPIQGYCNGCGYWHD